MSALSDVVARWDPEVQSRVPTLIYTLVGDDDQLEAAAAAYLDGRIGMRALFDAAAAARAGRAE